MYKINLYDKTLYWPQDKQSQYYPFGVSERNSLPVFRNIVNHAKTTITKIFLNSFTNPGKLLSNYNEVLFAAIQ
jgi:hypothetical protein